MCSSKRVEKTGALIAPHGKTDITSQVFMPFAANFHGGVRTASGNFDGDYTTADSLVTAAGPGGSARDQVAACLASGE